MLWSGRYWDECREKDAYVGIRGGDEFGVRWGLRRPGRQRLR
jgi:hypothetical protein